jgi:hypothetical protein
MAGKVIIDYVGESTCACIIIVGCCRYYDPKNGSLASPLKQMYENILDIFK